MDENTSVKKLKSRFEELKALENGWHGGRGKALNHCGLDMLAMAFEFIYPADFPTPHVNPTIDGNVMLEWRTEYDFVQLEVELDSLKGKLVYVDQEGEEDTFSFDLKTLEGWLRMLGVLEELV